MVACQKFVTWASAIAAVIGATTAGLLSGQGAAHAASPATLSAAAFAPIKGLAVGKIDGRFFEVAFINTGTVDRKRQGHGWNVDVAATAFV